MQDERLSHGRAALAAFGVGVLVAAFVLVSIAVYNNSWQVWDTASFCGSYADFQDPPVAEVCLSFPEYLRQSLGHLPHIGPALVVGALAAVAWYHRDRLRRV